ncbi:MAG: hypothetical protein ACOC7W_03485, partial [Desulfosalsimonas sp.]
IIKSDGTVKSFSHSPMFLREGSPAVGISFFAPDRKRSMSLQKPIPTLDFLGSLILDGAVKSSRSRLAQFRRMQRTYPYVKF